MNHAGKTRLVIAAATLFLGTGFAAGFVVRPAVQTAAPIEDRLPAPEATAEGRPIAATPAERQQGALLAAASTWSQLPKLQVPVAAPSEAPARKPLILEDLPEPVQKVLAQLTLGRKVLAPEYRLRDHRGQKYYKAEFHVDGLEQEYAIDEQGQVLASEFDMPVSDVPKVVTTAIEAMLPGAVLLEAERNELRDSPPFFEIELKHAGQQMELHVGEDGRIIRQKVR